MRFIILFILVLITGAPALGAKAKKAEPKPDAPQCMPIGPLVAKAKEHGVELIDITDGTAVLKIVAALKANVDKPFPMPSRIIIAFIGEEAKIGLVVNDKLCSVITAPVAPIRALLKAVHGVSIRHNDI